MKVGSLSSSKEKFVQATRLSFYQEDVYSRALQTDRLHELAAKG